MDRTQPGVGEADPREQRRVRHARPGGRRTRSVRVRVPREQAVARGLEPRQRERVGDRRRPERDVRLEQLRERVHPVGRDPDRSHAREQVRVDDRIRGDEPLVAERALVARRPALADHRVARGLGARARGRGHRDERHRRAGVGDAGPAGPRGGRRRSFRCAAARRPPWPRRARSRRRSRGRRPRPRIGAQRRSRRRRPATARRARWPRPPASTPARLETREQRVAPPRCAPATGRPSRAAPGRPCRADDLRHPRERARPELDPRQAAERERAGTAGAHPAAVSGYRPS